MRSRPATRPQRRQPGRKQPARPRRGWLTRFQKWGARTKRPTVARLLQKRVGASIALRAIGPWRKLLLPPAAGRQAQRHRLPVESRVAKRQLPRRAMRQKRRRVMNKSRMSEEGRFDFRLRRTGGVFFDFRLRRGWYPP